MNDACFIVRDQNGHALAYRLFRKRARATGSCQPAHQRRGAADRGARGQGVGFAAATITVIPYAETLLAKSQELISRGDFNIATVVAHMACEIAAERAISRAFAHRDLGYLENAVTSFVGYNLASKRNRNLYNALSGRTIHEQPFWQAFTDSAQRRNAAVHGGANVTKEEAEDTESSN
jgi:hypothetical protein